MTKSFLFLEWVMLNKFQPVVRTVLVLVLLLGLGPVASGKPLGESSGCPSDMMWMPELDDEMSKGAAKGGCVCPAGRCDQLARPFCLQPGCHCVHR